MNNTLIPVIVGSAMVFASSQSGSGAVLIDTQRHAALHHARSFANGCSWLGGADYRPPGLDLDHAPGDLPCASHRKCVRENREPLATTLFCRGTQRCGRRCRRWRRTHGCSLARRMQAHASMSASPPSGCEQHPPCGCQPTSCTPGDLTTAWRCAVCDPGRGRGPF